MSTAEDSGQRLAAGSPPEPASAHVLSALPILILYPHSRCNCRCLMCDIWKLTTAEEISVGQLQSHLEDIEALGVEWVVLSGGEPLMHSDLFRLTRLLKSRGIRTTILSTGLLLAAHAGSIVGSVDDVIVSLDGPPEVHDSIRRVPGAFARLDRGIRALRETRPNYPVSGRCTVQQANHRELRRTVTAARALGLDSISFLAADLTSTAFNRPLGWLPEQQERVGLTGSQTACLEEEIEALVSEQGEAIQSGFVREDQSKLDRLVHHFRAHLGLDPPLAPRCNAPWVSAVVESDGTVRPCFFHAPLGNIHQAGLRQILNGPTALAFRQQLDIDANEICRRCTCSLYRSGTG